ncbi:MULTISPECIES: hypothetical protein [unclassified Blastococcus]
MTRTPMPAPLFVAAAALALAAGCSTSVDGTPSSSGPGTASAPAPAAAPDELLGRVDLQALFPGVAVREFEVAARPDGSYLALVLPDDSEVGGGWLVELRPGGDGLAAGQVTDLPRFDAVPGLHVAPDGTAVLVDPLAEDPSVIGVAALPVGATEVELRQVDSGFDVPADTVASALSPDGGTVYLAATWREPGYRQELLAVDVDAGAVTAAEPVDVADPTAVPTTRVEATADGVVLLTTDRSDGEATATVAWYGTDLRPDGDPVPLAEEGGQSDGYALAVTPDGAAVVSVFEPEAETSRLLVVDADGIRTSIDLDEAREAPYDVTVDASGRRAYLPVNDRDVRTQLVTVDLTTGERTGTVLCELATLSRVAGAADGSTAVVTGLCPDDGDDAGRSAYLIG